MTRDASLDAFAGATDDEKGDEKGDEEDDETGGESAETVGDEPASISSTTEWSPSGAACASCGTVVERLWRQDGDLVCPDCKDWADA